MDFFTLFSQPDTYVSLLTLTFLEIILGIDNIIFISILTGKLPPHEQGKARTLGLALALIFRVLLLLSISWIAGLVHPLFTVFGFAVTGRSLILILGGLFLLFKSTMEIHEKLEGAEEKESEVKGKVKLSSLLIQIILLDLVFSFDSVITAVGLVPHVSIMIIAIILSMIVMLIFAKSVSDFIHRHPTIKMLALSFLLMIGLLLFLEGLHIEVPKGYVYFAMAFSFLVELLNIKLRKKSKPVELKEKYKE
ncbi:MAG: TerC family protein [Ignavibacteria bacterium]|jgi:predicted tellurium resistance membrane protein TerC|nr:TerC family protein [Ignavibacteria bacterium]MBN8571916.1 TerC family protein [Ignavibacteria bacterium]